MKVAMAALSSLTLVKVPRRMAWRDDPKWFSCRMPARDSRCRVCSPQEASIGAVPVKDVNWARSGNQATSATSARIRAAPAGQ